MNSGTYDPDELEYDDTSDDLEGEPVDADPDATTADDDDGAKGEGHVGGP